MLMYSCGASQREAAENIANRAELLLQNAEFETLYVELDELARSMTPKNEFNERAESLRLAMMNVDRDLRFVKSRNGGVNPDGFGDLYYEYRTLGQADRQMEVEISIDLKGTLKLFDVCVRPTSGLESEICLTNALRKI